MIREVPSILCIPPSPTLLTARNPLGINIVGVWEVWFEFNMEGKGNEALNESSAEDDHLGKDGFGAWRSVDPLSFISASLCTWAGFLLVWVLSRAV